MTRGDIAKNAAKKIMNVFGRNVDIDPIVKIVEEAIEKGIKQKEIEDRNFQAELNR